MKKGGAAAVLQLSAITRAWVPPTPNCCSISRRFGKPLSDNALQGEFAEGPLFISLGRSAYSQATTAERSFISSRSRACYSLHPPLTALSILLTDPFDSNFRPPSSASDGPIFDNSLVTNVTAQLGGTAVLRCKILNNRHEDPVSGNSAKRRFVHQ